MRRAVLLIALWVVTAVQGADDQARRLIDGSRQRHAPPSHLYEEQALIDTDRQGRYQVRTTRYYAKDRQRLWVLQTPDPLRGSRIRHTDGGQGGASLFGSGLNVADLAGLALGIACRYTLMEDTDLERVVHHVVRADNCTDDTGASPTRRFFLRHDNLFVSRVEHLDNQGRVTRRQHFRDPRPEPSGAWRAGLILMEDLRDGRSSLLRVDRRIASDDYVPDSVFDDTGGQS